MASGSSTPTSAGNYTEAEVIEKLGVAADASDYLKVKEINELLRRQGTPRGKTAQKAKQVALACTPGEVQAFRTEKETAALAAARPTTVHGAPPRRFRDHACAWHILSFPLHTHSTKS